MIRNVILLADASASYVVGGLSQLERLLCNLDEWFALADGGSPDLPQVTVLWRTHSLFDRRPTLSDKRSLRLRIEHVVNEANISSRSGTDGRQEKTLLMRTNVVLARNALERALQDSPPSIPLAICSEWPIRQPTSTNGSVWDALVEQLPASGVESRAGAPIMPGVLEGPADHGKVERRLFRSLGKESDGLGARYVNRPISTWLSRYLASAAIMPNTVTFGVAAVTLVSAWYLTRGTYWAFLLGTALFQLASILDGCDGEIARVKFRETRSGAWMDTWMDMIGNHLYVVALGIGLWRQPTAIPWLPTFYLSESLLSALGMALAVWAVARYTERNSGASHFRDFGRSVITSTRVEGHQRKVWLLLGQLTRKDTYTLVFLILAAAGYPEAILHLLATGVVIHAVALVVSSRQSKRLAVTT
jgi:phosphatidylglycerophosphate synthase